MTLGNEAKAHRTKAGQLLDQLIALDPATHAETVIHLGYYVMFHAATAVLIAQTDSAPTTHSGVLGRFGRLIRDGGQAARQAGRAFHLALDLRLLADYGVDTGSLVADAERLKDAAKPFSDVCDDLIRRDPPDRS